MRGVNVKSACGVVVRASIESGDSCVVEVIAARADHGASDNDESGDSCVVEVVSSVVLDEATAN